MFNKIKHPRTKNRTSYLSMFLFENIFWASKHSLEHCPMAEVLEMGYTASENQ